MKKPTSAEGKAGQENVAEYNPNRKHLQSVILSGAPCQYVRTYNNHLKIHVPIDSDMEMLGAGDYFMPYITEEVECRYFGLWDDIPEENKPKHEVGDLLPIVAFFRSGEILK